MQRTRLGPVIGLAAYVCIVNFNGAHDGAELVVVAARMRWYMYHAVRELPLPMVRLI
jgi:hypothetical protein